MEKSRISGMRSGSKPLIVITTAIILSIIIMISLFIIYFNKVYSSVLEKDMEQIEWTSHYVTKLIHTEIQHSVDILQASDRASRALRAQRTRDRRIDLLRVPAPASCVKRRAA